MRPRTSSRRWPTPSPTSRPTSTARPSSRRSSCRASSSTSWCADDPSRGGPLGHRRLSGPAMSRLPYIAVVGTGEASPQEAWLAEEVGAGLAAAGAVVVTGGLGGVMEAACRGAKSRHGATVGILPGEDRDAANGWVQVAIATGLGELRNGLVVRAADVVVAIGGGHGPLSEVALALKLGRPVVGLGTWALHDVEQVSTPADALERVAALLRR